jgi:hypothetical protein
VESDCHLLTGTEEQVTERRSGDPVAPSTEGLSCWLLAGGWVLIATARVGLAPSAGALAREPRVAHTKRHEKPPYRRANAHGSGRSAQGF